MNPNIVTPADAVAPVIQDSGFVVAQMIDNIRGIVSEAVHGVLPSAPPISLYTAGKFCQFLTVSAYDFKANIKLANSAYQAVAKGLSGTRSPNYPAFLGLLLIDSGLTDSLGATSFAPTPANQALTEFQISNASEITSFQTLATSASSFRTAQANLLGGVGTDTTWTSCREQFLGWSVHTDAMVI